MIQATTVNCKTMADDTLRLTIDISPGDAQSAFALFGARGLSCVVARLTAEAAIETAQQQAIATEKPKGGPLAKLAGMWCADPLFQHWACNDDAQSVAEWIRRECGIDSRAELDHNEVAAAIFHERIRIPFSTYCKEQGVEL